MTERALDDYCSPVGDHRWGKRWSVRVFDLPGAGMSGRTVNNSGTISKFNRMGVLAGFGSLGRAGSSGFLHGP